MKDVEGKQIGMWRKGDDTSDGESNTDIDGARGRGVFERVTERRK